MKKLEFDEDQPTCEEVEAIGQIAKISEESIHAAQRDQHPKQHGCVWAEFKVLDNLPEKLRIGVFREPKAFPAWIRFSSFKEDDDTKKDVNGMAVKLMGVDGEKALKEEDHATTQDFVLSTLRVFFVKNAQDYVELVKLNSFPKFIFPNLFKWRLREAGILASTRLRHQLHPIASPLETQYWSTTPYRLGPWAIKFFVKPSSDNLSGRKPGKTKNFLRETMVDYLKTQTAYFDFYIQLQDQVNPARTPVEDSRVEWKDVETHKVATIKIPPQIFNSPEQEQFGENLSFTPWHCLPEHAPIGSINRVRREVYRRTATLRRQLNRVPLAEPTPESFTPRLLPSSPPDDKPAQQNALAVLVPIKPDQEEYLTDFLEKMGRNHECPDNPSNSLFRKSSSTHFARFVVLKDPSQDLNTPHLLFSSNYDGEFSDYMQELVETMGADMDKIWDKCEGYELGSSLCTAYFTKFIKQYSLTPQVFYPAFLGKTVNAINNNRTAYEKLNQLLECIHNSELELKLQELYPYLSAETSSSQVSESLVVQITHALKKLTNSTFQVLRRLGTQATLRLKTVFLMMLESWVGIQHSAEQDPSKRLKFNPEQWERLQKITKLEDKIAQNQLTIFVPLKSDYFYRIFLWIVLIIISRVASKALPQLSAIHFARWVIIDRSKLKNSKHSYLLFESNYNRSWDSYIDDFVERFGTTMNLIWGNCIEFPAGGTKDIEWFKQHIRRYQFPAQIFYSAYPDLTISTIQKDIEVRSANRQFLELLKNPKAKQLFTGF